MNEVYKVEIDAIDTTVNLPVKKLYFDKERGTDIKHANELICTQNCDNVRAVTSLWDDETQDWYEDSDVTYFHPNTKPDYYLLRNAAHECRLKHALMQEYVIHIPTRTLFWIDERVTTYPKENLEDPECLFYKFKYTTELGKEYKFTVYCNLRGSGKTQEELQDILENVLKPAAMWFCNHIRESYRHYNEDDAWSKIRRRKKEMSSDL